MRGLRAVLCSPPMIFKKTNIYSLTINKTIITSPIITSTTTSPTITSLVDW